MIITNSTADDYYFEQLIAFITSIKLNSPKHLDKMIVFLANYPDKKEKSLKNAFPEITFENNKLKMIDERGFAMIIDRAYRVFSCLEKFKENVTWMDTDVIVRGDLSGLVNIKPKQFKILFRKGQPERIRINAGIFNIGYSQICCNFMKDWYQGCLLNKKWGNGQLELWRSYKRFSKKIELIDITKKFNSVGRHFEKEYIIWHCKMAHFDNPTYQEEYQVYLKEAKKIIDGVRN